MSIRERIRPVLDVQPDQRAVVRNSYFLTWRQIAHLIDDLAEIVRRANLPKGASIGLLARNMPEHAAAVAAVLCADACLVPVNPFSSIDHVLEDLKELDVPVLLASVEDWKEPQLEAFARERGLLALQVDADGITPLFGRLNPQGDGFRSAQPGTAIEMLSSGTTGKPKRIRLEASNVERALAGKGLKQQSNGTFVLPRSPGLVSSPLVHISGIFWIISHFAEGRCSILLDRFSVAAWVDAVKTYRLRYAGLVPTGIKMLLDAQVPKEDLSSLIAVRSGTAPLSPELQKTFEHRYGIPVLNQYGATEFAGAVIGWTLELHQEFALRKPGSVGRALGGVELKILDVETGQEVASGGTGLLAVKAPQLGGKDWIKTNDLASIDEDGFVWIRGRADNAIIRGGFKIVPSEVVELLEKHPSVRNAAVVGIDDERLGQVPVAAVELASGSERVNGEELRTWIKERTTAYYVPIEIKVVDVLPRTPSMKVSEPAVKALFSHDYPKV